MEEAHRHGNPNDEHSETSVPYTLEDITRVIVSTNSNGRDNESAGSDVTSKNRFGQIDIENETAYASRRKNGKKQEPSVKKLTLPKILHNINVKIPQVSKSHETVRTTSSLQSTSSTSLGDDEEEQGKILDFGLYKPPDNHAKVKVTDVTEGPEGQIKPQENRNPMVTFRLGGESESETDEAESGSNSDTGHGERKTAKDENGNRRQQQVYDEANGHVDVQIVGCEVNGRSTRDKLSLFSDGVMGHTMKTGRKVGHKLDAMKEMSSGDFYEKSTNQGDEILKCDDRNSDNSLNNNNSNTADNNNENSSSDGVQPRRCPSNGSFVGARESVVMSEGLRRYRRRSQLTMSPDLPLDIPLKARRSESENRIRDNLEYLKRRVSVQEDNDTITGIDTRSNGGRTGTFTYYEDQGNVSGYKNVGFSDSDVSTPSPSPSSPTFVSSHYDFDDAKSASPVNLPKSRRRSEGSNGSMGSVRWEDLEEMAAKPMIEPRYPTVVTAGATNADGQSQRDLQTNQRRRHGNVTKPMAVQQSTGDQETAFSQRPNGSDVIKGDDKTLDEGSGDRLQGHRGKALPYKVRRYSSVSMESGASTNSFSSILRHDALAIFNTKMNKGPLRRLSQISLSDLELLRQKHGTNASRTASKPTGRLSTSVLRHDLERSATSWKIVISDVTRHVEKTGTEEPRGTCSWH